MGNTPPSSSRRRRASSSAYAAERAKKVVGDIGEELKRSVKKLDDDHPAAQLIDSVCGGYFDDDKYRQSRSASFYSEDHSEDGSRTVSEDDATYDDHSRTKKDATSVESSSYMSQSDYDSEPKRRTGSSGRKGASVSFDTEEDSKVLQEDNAPLLSKPLASSFAKRCYFTKAGIGKTTQHYEGLTLTGNIVLMLAAAMKLKGCPTICDEDLRRVEQTYPNQFSRLPDELLLSSGWRRISKYCHFSNKPIPDGVPFFHSKQRLHPSGGYYFLLAGAVGMVRPIDVEPLTRDTLVLLETDFPVQCDAVPDVLIREPDQWTLVNKFCFFSGGPINTEEDVYYQADFDGNPIYMLAFLSPSLTPEELYKLGDTGEPGLKSCAAVHEVESVYDLTERDFNDLKLYHLGPCRALPQYILQPQAWTKVLPPHFLAARQTAMLRAQDYETRHGVPPSSNPASPQSGMHPPQGADFGGTDAYFNQPWQAPQPQLPPQEMMPPPSPDVQNNTNLDNGAYPHPPADGNGMYQQPTQHPSVMYSPQQPPPFENGIYQQPPPSSREPKATNSRDYHEPEPHVEHMSAAEFQREVEEEGAFIDSSVPMDEAIASRFPVSPPGKRTDDTEKANTTKMDPPDDEPPSLTKRENEGSHAPFHERNETYPQYYGEHSANHHAGDPEASPEEAPGVDDDHGEFIATADPSYYLPPGQNEAIANHGYAHSHSQDYRLHGSATEEMLHAGYMEPSPLGEGGPSDFVSPDDNFGAMPSEFSPGDERYPRGFSATDDHYSRGYPMQDGRVQVAEEEYAHAVDERFANPSNSQYSPQEGYPQEDDGHFTFQSGMIDAVDDYEGPEEMYPPEDDHYFEAAEEKKVAMDEPVDPQLEFAQSRDYSEGEPLAVDTDADFIPIKRDGYKLGASPSPKSIGASSDGTPISQSSALRGAQELLKKNRRRRMEMALKTRQRDDPPPDFEGGDRNHPVPHMDDGSAGTWESGSEISASVISGSSVWTDHSNPADRSSRRKFILQMAKARMKSNKDSQSPSAASATGHHSNPSAIQEEPSNDMEDEDLDTQPKATLETGATESNPADFDFAADLD